MFVNRRAELWDEWPLSDMSNSLVVPISTIVSAFIVVLSISDQLQQLPGPTRQTSSESGTVWGRAVCVHMCGCVGCGGMWSVYRCTDIHTCTHMQTLNTHTQPHSTTHLIVRSATYLSYTTAIQHGLCTGNCAGLLLILIVMPCWYMYICRCNAVLVLIGGGLLFPWERMIWTWYRGLSLMKLCHQKR